MKALIVLAGIYMVGISFAVPIHSNNTTDPFEHGNNPWVQAAMDFGVDPTFANLVFESGGGDVDMALMCGSNAWTTCENDIYGPFPTELDRCITMYLCAYYECEQCDGIQQTLCIDGAQYDLLQCSGIDLMALMNRWDLTHEEAVEVLRGML